MSVRQQPTQALTDEMLDAVARAESAEAALDLAQADLRETRAERDLARRERDELTGQLDAVRTIHTTWRETDNAEDTLDMQSLWEDLLAILFPGTAPAPDHLALDPEAVICPECRSGKCLNCTKTVPTGDGPVVLVCACLAAGHGGVS